MTLTRKILIGVLALVVMVAGVGVVSYLVFPGTVREQILGFIQFAQTRSAIGTLTADGVIIRTNSERAAVNLPALKENTTLDAAAKEKLDDMFTKQYFDHISPQGVGPADLAQSVGYAYLVDGENLAMGNFQNNSDLVAAWMASPGHRANILNTRFVDIGVAVGKGVYKGKETWIAVQEFGTPASLCPSIDASLKAEVDQDKSQSDSIAQQLDALKQDLDTKPQTTQADRDSYNATVVQYNKLVSQYTALTTKLRTEIDQYNSQVQAFNKCLNSNGS